MGKHLLFLVSLLACFGSFSFVLNKDDSCISLCIFENSDDTLHNGSRCIPLPVNACNGSTLTVTATTVKSEKATFSHIDMKNVEEIQYLNLTSNQTSDVLPDKQGTILLEWEVTDTDWLTSASAIFKLEVNRNQSEIEELTESTKRYCNIYNLTTLTFLNISQKVTITDTCVSVTSSGQFNISLTTGGNDDPLSYVFTTPTNLSASISTGTAQDWHPVTGFSLDLTEIENLATGYVVVQMPPLQRDITGYNITITDEHGDLQKNSGSQNVTTAKLMVPILSTGFYFAKLISSGPGCSNGSNCETYETGSIYMKKKQLPAPTFSVITTTTPVPVPPTKNTSTTTHGPVQNTTDSGVHEEPANGEQKKTILIGCLVGIFGAGVVIGLVFLVYRWRKYGRAGLCPATNRQFNRLDSGMELSIQQNGPNILLLYSCDCEYHEQVVIEFALYMHHNFACKISVDIWEQNDIQERGAFSWLMDKLETSQYIMVVCSVSARLKCARSRWPLQTKVNRPVPDIFSAAVEYVAEKMWQMKSEGRESCSLLVVCFDYSGENDIPPKLDRAPRFFLPNDLASLYCHLHHLEYEEGIETTRDFYGKTGATFFGTDTGSQLEKALCNAKDFFANNPTWLLEELEQTQDTPSPQKEIVNSAPLSPALQQVVPPPTSFTSEPLYKVNGHIPQIVGQDTSSNKQQNFVDIQSVPVNVSATNPERDALLEARLHANSSIPAVMTMDPKCHRPDKRQSVQTPFQNGWKNMVRHSKKLMHSLQNKEDTQGYCNLDDSQLFSPEPDWNRRNGESPSYSNSNKAADSPESSSGKTKSGDTVSIDSDSICNDEAQLKKDMEFIRNYQYRDSPEKPDMLQLISLDSDPSAGDQCISNHSTYAKDLVSLPSLSGSSQPVVNGSVVLPSLVPSHNVPICVKEASLENNNNITLA